MSGIKNGMSITLVYEVINSTEFGLVNPLQIEHNGLSVYAVSVGDLLEKKNAYENELKRLLDIVDDDDIDRINEVLSL